jgi:hypothetical protein
MDNFAYWALVPNFRVDKGKNGERPQMAFLKQKFN